MKRLVCLLGILGVLAQPALAAEPEGKSLLLMEASTGQILRQENAHAALAPASVTKVMTLLLIMEAVDSRAIRWEDPVTASETAAAKGGSQVYLKAGEVMTVRDMVKSIAVSSANDCACAMAEHLAGSEAAFAEKMNAKAAELGMADSHFVNCTGLDDGENAALHRTSAHDVALMSRELLTRHPDIKKFTTIWMDTIRDGAFGLSNTNKLIRFYPGATGLKTGYTSGAGFCLAASACREDMELIAVVLGADSSRARFGACRELLDYGFANFALVVPEAPTGRQVPVVLGSLPGLEPVLGDRGGLLVEKARKNGVETEVLLEPSVEAPVSRGQRLGVLRLLSQGQVLAELPLVAPRAVARLTWTEIFVKILGRAAMAKGT